MTVTRYHAGRLYRGTRIEIEATTPPADAVGDFAWATDNDELFIWSGTAWISMNALGISDLFLHSEVADIAGYEQLLDTPADDAEATIATIVNAAGGETLINEWITYPTTGLGLTLLTGGAWHFHVYAMVDNATGVTNIRAKVYKRASGGAETLLFTVETDEIDATSVTHYEVDTVQPDIALLATDRIVVKYYCITTSVANRTVTFYYEGTINYSHITLPFSVTSGTLISGSGTAGTIPRFTAARTLGNSQVTQDGSEILIASRDLRLDTGKATIAGDILTDAWQDWYASATINGWSSITTTQLYYKKIGKIVMVGFFLSGTSNATNANFSLPYINNSQVVYNLVIRVVDNGNSQFGSAAMAAGGGTCNLRADATANNNSWTASGTKTVQGMLIYITN